MVTSFQPKPAYDVAIERDALVIHLHKEFEPNGRDHDWANVITARFSGPYARVTVDLTHLGPRVNSSFFSGLYRLYQQYGRNGQRVVLRGAHERAVQGLEILALRPLFDLA